MSLHIHQSCRTENVSQTRLAKISGSAANSRRTIAHATRNLDRPLDRRLNEICIRQVDRKR
jgi:hypothetical protein